MPSAIGWTLLLVVFCQNVRHCASALVINYLFTGTNHSCTAVPFDQWVLIPHKIMDNLCNGYFYALLRQVDNIASLNTVSLLFILLSHFKLNYQQSALYRQKRSVCLLSFYRFK